MFLLRRRIRGQSIKHPLASWGTEKLDYDQLKRLADDLKAGIDTTSELIRAHMKLAIHIAGQYASIHRRSADDIVSEAIIGMLTACKRIKENEMTDDNVAGFIISNIHSAIKSFVRKDSVVRVPPSSYRHFKDKGIDVGITVSSLPYLLPDREKRKPIELLEILDKIASDDFDRDVIALKAEGYTIKEIANKLSVSTSKVFLSKAKLENKYANFSTV